MENHEIVVLGLLYVGVLLVAHYLSMVWAVAAAAAALLVSWKSLFRLLRELLWEQWIKIDREVRGDKESSGSFDWKPIVILGVATLVLTGNHYYGHRNHFRYFAAKTMAKKEDARWLRGANLKNSANHSGVQRVYRKRVRDRLGKWWLLGEFGYWTLWRVLGFFILPALLIFALPKEKLGEYGLKLGGTKDALLLCGILFAFMFAAVFMVSYKPAFRYHYPFPWANSAPPGGVPGSLLVTWWLMYGVQFFALEFFFRGFLLHGLKKSMGAYSIFAMVVPYAMIHFGKPVTETLGAFAAGLVLGTMALATRSIWCGVMIHIAIAWSMDFLAIFQKGILPSRW